MSSSKNIIPIKFKEVTSRTAIANWYDYYDVNAGAIVLNTGIVVIDSLMYPIQAKQFKEALEKKSGLPVTTLFLTHIHGDHLFGMASFRDTKIICSNILIEVIKRKLENEWTKDAFDEWKEEEPAIAEYIKDIEILVPTLGFDEQYVLEDRDLRVEFYLSGGHTSCSSYAYFPEEKVLFAGDLISAGFWPFISDPGGDPEKWMKSLEHMLSFGDITVVPGHGPIVDKKCIEEQLEFMKKLKNSLLNAIKDDLKPEEIELPQFYEPAVDWQIPRALDFLLKYYSTLEE